MATESTIGTMSPANVSLDKDRLLLLDVRTPAEYSEAHIDGAVSHPLTNLDPKEVEKFTAGKKSCILVCRSGGRARKAAEKLAMHGMTALFVMEGGVSAWEAAGLPLVRGKSVMSLERQVRIAAGCLVVVGSVLGYFVNPGWMLLAGGVGAGLVFAGVTDTCGMGMMLARMPWNNRPSGCNSASVCETK